MESIRISAKKRRSAGCTLLAVGITFAVIFGLGTLGCLIGLGTISPAALGDVVVSATAVSYTHLDVYKRQLPGTEEGNGNAYWTRL